jgi:hypothetical protein
VTLAAQIVWLFILALPVAAVSWTVTQEEVLREPREFCRHCSRALPRWWHRKFFYVFTCEYCFSHYVAAFFVGITGYKLLEQDWRGYLIGGLAMVWIANLYMSLFSHLRLDLKKERAEITEIQKEERAA